jgi:hypothetical protein
LLRLQQETASLGGQGSGGHQKFCSRCHLEDNAELFGRGDTLKRMEKLRRPTSKREPLVEQGEAGEHAVTAPSDEMVGVQMNSPLLLGGTQDPAKTGEGRINHARC